MFYFSSLFVKCKCKVYLLVCLVFIGTFWYAYMESIGGGQLELKTSQRMVINNFPQWFVFVLKCRKEKKLKDSLSAVMLEQ